MKETNNPDRTSEISGINMGFNFSYFLGKNTLKYGIELSTQKTDFEQYSIYGNIRIPYSNNSTEIGAYVKYKASLGKFLFEPSLRLQHYSEFGPQLEPRIALKFNATDRFRLKGAAGHYTQDLVAGTSDRDVVNLFYGFLAGNMEIPTYFNGKKLNTSLQKADHYILGAEFDLTNNLTMNIEGYWKHFGQLTNLNRNKMYDGTNPAYMNVNDLLKKNFMVEQGDAYGFDLSLKFENRRWYLWAVYAYGHVKRDYEKYDNGEINLVSYQPHFDRRHNVNIILTYTAGDLRQWEFSGRWNFGTGFPFTQVQGYYESLTFQQGINSNYIIDNGNLGVLYGELNQGRLPTYHRLDLDAKRKIFFSEKTILEIDLSITNVYNRKNIFYIDIIDPDKKIYQLPILPSLGLNLSF